jgi:TRAP-type mannitol/chloroaromatic compound transport system permease small subunit
MSSIERLCKLIDTFTENQGRVACWIAVPMVVSLTYEVFARYMFNAPTSWSYDVTYMIYGSHYLLGAAFALLHKVHIRIDVFYNLFPKKVRQLIDIFTYIFIFFPVFIVLAWSAVSMATDAHQTSEVSQFSPWAPLLWPYKTIIAISFIFLVLQGISEFIRSLVAFSGGFKKGEAS